MSETKRCLADERAAWEAGFKLAVSYGDNWIHFDGEQKERQWQRYLATAGKPECVCEIDGHDYYCPVHNEAQS